MSEQLSEEPERPASAPRASKRGTLGRVYILIGGTVLLIAASLLVVHSLPLLPGYAPNSAQLEGFDPRTATFTVRDAATQQCRQVTFRNDTTELVETSFRCDGRPSANAANSSASRLGVLRKAFTPQ